MLFGFCVGVVVIVGINVVVVIDITINDKRMIVISHVNIIVIAFDVAKVVILKHDLLLFY